MMAFATAEAPGAATTAIACSHLFKTYETAAGEEINALVDINLTVADGEFVSIVGPSGCGKSTLQKILAGLLPASRGEALIRGRPAGTAARDIGIVFQSPTLLEWRTVLGNTMLIRDVHNLDRAKMEARARELIALVGLEGFEKKYPGELSGGMQQRIAITRALIHEPSVLLMDEPFGALDAMTREQMTIELQRIWMNQSLSALFITHSISEAVFLSDRVAVMSARPGKILEVIDIDLPRPRDLHTIGTPEFSALTNHIRHLLDAKALVE